MLRFLGVRHLAVIDELAVEFESGLNLITGETGAGKSMLVEAIDLLVGGRASADLVRTGETTATIQAVFEEGSGREVIVRRELSAQGRSRAFIDDALATTAALKELGDRWIDLHGQHEHQTLLEPAEHLAQLDGFLDEPALVADVATKFDAWRAAATALGRIQIDDRERRLRLDMARFQLQEIDKISPNADEDAALAAERSVLANVDRLSRLSRDAYAALYDGEHAALPALATVWKRVSELASLDPRFTRYVDEREALKSQLEDLAFFLRTYDAGLEAAPDRLQTVEDRLAALERLKKKFGPTLGHVLDRQRDWREEIATLESGTDRVAALQHAEAETRTHFAAAATSLSRARQAAALKLARALESALAEVALPKSRVEIRVSTATNPDEFTRAGLDHAEFFLSTNPGEAPKPLAKIASGGELSRIMLALRTLTGGDDPNRTLVFDEVDAGIGGAAADAVGARLQALARRHQVLCITHLPQIAARAGAHFQISKQVRNGRTITALSRLDAAGRELEVARMIAGAEVSPHVLTSAREMLAFRSESEVKAKGETAPKAKVKAQR